MPMVIPAQRLPEVAPSTSPAPGFAIQATPDDFGAGIGRAMSGIGATLGQASDDASRLALAQQELTNETQAKEAATSFDRQSIDLAFDPKNGFFAQMGKNAVDGYQGALDGAEKIRQNVLDGLPNARARLMADQVIVRKLGSLQESMGQHAQQQRKVWMTDASNARIASTIDDGVANYTDPVKWGQTIATIKDEVLSQGELNGQAPEAVAQAQQAQTSKAWTARVDRMAIDDPVKAQDLYRSNSDQFAGNDQIAVEKMLKSATMPVLTRNLGERVMQGGTTPADMPTLFAAQQKAESGVLENAISVKGARGVMQLMPDTAKEVAGKLGLPYDPERLLKDDTYNQTLGQAYMTEMLQRYGGDQTVALAAYNAGPGRVDNALKVIGDPRNGAINDQDWINKFPYKETRDYVAKINAAAPPKPGTMPTSADVQTHLGDWMAQTRAAATAAWPNNPEAVEQAVSHVEQTANQITRGQQFTMKAAQNSLIGKALGLVSMPDGGFTRAIAANRPATLDQLLSDPQSKVAWSQMDSISQHGILSLLDANAKGTSPPLNDQAWSKYYELKGTAARDPVAFQSVNLADPALTNLLPHEMTSQLMNEQATMATKQGRDLAKGENLDHALAIAKPSLMALGVNVAPKTGTSDAATFDQFVGKLDNSMSTFMAQNKRSPSDGEVRQMVSSLLIQGSQAGAGFLGFSRGVRLFQSTDPSKFTPSVPTPDRNAITLAYKQRNGGKEPTDREISDWYMRAQGAAAGAK